MQASEMDIDMDRLRETLRDNEGIQTKVYEDSLGKKTGGIGHLLEYDARWSLGDEIPANLIEEWFQADVAQAIADAKMIFDECWDRMNGKRKEACVDWCFQCGRSGVKGFRKCVAAIKAGNWGIASYEHIDSKGFRQTPRRFKRRAKVFAYGM